MQIPYDPGMPISEYNIAVKEKRIKFPSFKECCAICGRAGCAHGNGFYYRLAYDENNCLIEKLPIKRNECTTFGKTFSLLIIGLVPYRKHSLKIMTHIMVIWKKYTGKIAVTLDNLFTGWESVNEGLWDTGASQVNRIKGIFEEARHKYVVFKKINLVYSLNSFIGECSSNDCDAVSKISSWYYTGNGGHKSNSPFLFGRASQFRQPEH